jgi:hypothetical protein
LVTYLQKVKNCWLNFSFAKGGIVGLWVNFLVVTTSSGFFTGKTHYLPIWVFPLTL